MNQQIQKNQSELSVVNAQLSSKQTTSRIIAATKQELQAGSHNDTVWEGCGKIFIAQPIDEYLKRLDKDEETLVDQTKALKIKENYLVTSIEKTVDSLNTLIQKEGATQ